MEANSSGDMVLTQWFERARFEYHPGNPEPYRVLLGRLGAELNGEPAPMPELVVAVEPPAIAQGHSTSLAAMVVGATGVVGSLGDARLQFFDRDGAWRAYGGIPVLTPAGSHIPLRVEAALADGRTALRELSIVAGDAGYATENINLPPDVNRRPRRKCGPDRRRASPRQRRVGAGDAGASVERSLPHACTGSHHQRLRYQSLI